MCAALFTSNRELAFGPTAASGRPTVCPFSALGMWIQQQHVYMFTTEPKMSETRRAEESQYLTTETRDECAPLFLLTLEAN